ncbi:DUF1796 family putative cysteine peptidase [Methylocystis sp. ATCC 49242]|uniref:DUF1796 family putative cysteine peptidase n=1 Tax=Methylocystis sp. ATCC 49242 TaxID=622637 RepID=UPI00055D291B|nr:DUF1796 family putative cysteine peptidase [Methylocystis sp. ATCC 49242]
MKLSEIQKPYDLFVSLGSACDPAAHLRRRGLRKFSMPLDWVASLSLPDVCRLFEDRFIDYMNINNMQRIDGTANYYDEEAVESSIEPASQTTQFIPDSKYNVISVHDFAVVKDVSWQEQYPAYREKLVLRIKRLLSSLQQAESALFVRWSGALETAIELHKVLSLLTMGRADLLLLQPVQGVRIVTPCESGTSGVCVVQTPNLPADASMWDNVLEGMTLRA